MAAIRIAVFASGSGTNAQNIFRVAKNSHIEVMALICDRPDAKVLRRAKSFQIPSHLIEYNGSKLEHEKKIIEVVEGVDWIFLAGYMRILSSDFINQFNEKALGHSRIVNIHPSLLPKYPGLNSYERAYAAGDIEYGPSLHYVDEGIDSGEIIEQTTLARNSEDTLDEFIQRGLQAEYELYRKFITNLNPRNLK